MSVEQELRQALEQRDETLRSLGEKAKAEIRELESRLAELRRLVGRLESTNEPDDMTLHEAMARILESESGQGMSARELAEAVDRARLYKKRDGSAVDGTQVHARARNYPALFTKSGQRIELRHDYSLSPLDPRGSYEANLVTVVDRRSDDRMTVEVRVSYTALAMGVALERISLQKARELVARSQFVPDTHSCHLMTTNGWVVCGEDEM